LKAHLTWDQQIQLLRANGLQINDENSAFTLLSTYGYFRLRGYFHVFLESQEDDHSKKSSKFLGGSDINQIADLMEFDQKLRVLLFDALSQFEIALRTKFSYFGGEIDPQLHVTGIGLHLPASKSKSNAEVQRQDTSTQSRTICSMAHPKL
jgi:abortive infection bacteriophage resistance protein